MRLRDIKEVLLEELKPFAQENGFKIRKGDFSLSKKIGDINSRIWFLNLHWPDEVQILPQVGVDVPELHAIYKEFIGRPLGSTASINLLLLKKIREEGLNDETRWLLSLDCKDRVCFVDGDDIREKCQELKALMPLALEYINTNSSIEAISRLFNTLPIIDYNPNCVGIATHKFIGLISAKLSKAENYAQLRDIYVKMTREEEDLTPDYKETFYKLVDYLETYE